MVAVTATVTSPFITNIVSCRKRSAGVSSGFVAGLPQITVRGGMSRCSSEVKAVANTKASVPLAAAVASMFAATGPALALVDERLSTEGTGLSLGLSNNLLGWILLGVFALIWALYFAYTSTLEEDEESGLSL